MSESLAKEITIRIWRKHKVESGYVFESKLAKTVERELREQNITVPWITLRRTVRHVIREESNQPTT